MPILTVLPALSEQDRDTRRRAAARRRNAIRALTALVVFGGASGAAALLLTGGGHHRQNGRASTFASVVSTTAPVKTAASTTTAAHSRLHPLRIIPATPGVATVVRTGPARNEVALTFDDGFCRTCVGGILHVLERTGAHATICPNGTYGPTTWDHYRRLVRRLIALGQLAICNHTFTHRDAVSLSESALEDDIQRNEQWIEQEFGVSARPYFRPPYGSYNATTLAAAGKLGYTSILLWSGTLADSTVRDIPYLRAAIRYWAKPGAIILAHGNYPATPRALMSILRILKARHLRTVTIPELLEHSGR